MRKHLTRQTPFVLRPWAAHPEDRGDPSHPEAVHGVEVIDQIRTRRDGRPGAVVLLEDGRYAFTGNVVALGNPSQVQMAARRRLRLAKTDSERALVARGDRLRWPRPERYGVRTIFSASRLS